MILNRRELADAIGVDQQSIKLWHEWGCPCESVKAGREGYKYDLAKVFHWRISRNEDGAETQREKTSRLNNELKELELAKERELVVDREDVIRRWAACVSAMRNRLRALRRKVTPLITTPDRRVEVEAILGKHIDEALMEMTTDEFAKAVMDGPTESVASSEATAEPERKSVGRRKAPPE